jgi:hypothetical protein
MDYMVEWSTSSDFVDSNHIEEFALYFFACVFPRGSAGCAPITIPDLDPGTEYHVRVYAKNEVGFGPPTEALYDIPRVAPDQLEYEKSVILCSTPAGKSVSVDSSSHSLTLDFAAPFSDQGAEIDRYHIEWFAVGAGRKFKSSRCFRRKSLPGHFPARIR